MDNYNEFCKESGCDEYIEWDYVFDSEYQPYPCTSCQKIGQSHDIDEYPPDCPFLDEIELVNIGE